MCCAVLSKCAETVVFHVIAMLGSGGREGKKAEEKAEGGRAGKKSEKGVGWKGGCEKKGRRQGT